MDAERRPRLAEDFEAFVLGHGGGLARGAGEDDGLRDFGERQFGGEARGGAGEGGNAGDDLIGDAKRIEAAHLFGDGAIDRGVAGMNAGNILA